MDEPVHFLPQLRLPSVAATAIPTSDGAIRIDLGKPGLATPEHLVAAGYAACFGGSLDFVAKRRKRDATKAKITCAVTIGSARRRLWHRREDARRGHEHCANRT